MYKIIETNQNSFFIQAGNKQFFPVDDNPDYQRFVQEVVEQGYGIVEGPDLVQPSYGELRKEEYPPIADQLDKIYHSGVAAWKKDIKAIKDKYPKTITGRTDIGPLPDVLYQSVNNYIYNQKLNAYVDAVERLAQYRLVEGQSALWSEKMDEMGDKIETYLSQEGCKPLPADDPRVIKDEEERAAAKAVIDSTPQNIIDAINN